MAVSHLHQRPTHKRPSSFLNRTNLTLVFSLLIILGFFYPYLGISQPFFSNPNFAFQSKWRNYSLQEAVSFVGRNGTVIVCIVSEPYLDFLNNWLISVTRHKHQDKVLVIAEDYNTLYRVNQRWPGHAVLIPPVLESNSAHKFGSLGFFNFTARRPRHLLNILELGFNVMYNDVDMVWLKDPFPYLEGNHDVYFMDDVAAVGGFFNFTARRPRHLLNILELGFNVMYNDVDMVWLKDPFPYLEGNHDVYFMDDVAAVKPLNHSHALPPPGKKGRPYVCSCMIFLRSTSGAKLAMRKWLEELQEQPWTRAKKANDQPAFNWALMKIEKQVDMYLLPQSAFPTGGLYFKNKTWVRETEGSHVIIHNNYILGFEKKIKRFRDYGLWLVDDYAAESPLGKL